MNTWSVQGLVDEAGRYARATVAPIFAPVFDALYPPLTHDYDEPVPSFCAKGECFYELDGADQLADTEAEEEVHEPACECFVTDEKSWFRYGSAVEPGSQMEWNPDCPAHPGTFGCATCGNDGCPDCTEDVYMLGPNERDRIWLHGDARVYRWLRDAWQWKSPAAVSWRWCATGNLNVYSADGIPFVAIAGHPASVPEIHLPGAGTEPTSPARTPCLVHVHRGRRWIGHAGWVYTADPDSDGWIGRKTGLEDIYLHPKNATSQYGPFIEAPLTSPAVSAAVGDSPAGVSAPHPAPPAGHSQLIGDCFDYCVGHLDPSPTGGEASPADDATPLAPAGDDPNWIDWATPAICEVLAQHRFIDCSRENPGMDQHAYREHVGPLIAQRICDSLAAQPEPVNDAANWYACCGARRHGPHFTHCKAEK